MIAKKGQASELAPFSSFSYLSDMKYIEIKVVVSSDCYELHYLPEGSPDIAHWVAQGVVVNENPAAKIKPPGEKKIKDSLPKSPHRMTWKDWAVANGK